MPKFTAERALSSSSFFSLFFASFSSPSLLHVQSKTGLSDPDFNLDCFPLLFFSLLSGLRPTVSPTKAELLVHHAIQYVTITGRGLQQWMPRLHGSLVELLCETQKVGLLCLLLVCSSFFTLGFRW